LKSKNPGNSSGNLKTAGFPGIPPIPYQEFPVALGATAYSTYRPTGTRAEYVKMIGLQSADQQQNTTVSWHSWDVRYQEMEALLMCLVT